MESILLVEDNRADAERVSRFLHGRPDTTLTVAETGEKALNYLGHEWFSHLLLDYRLPDTNGLELLQVVRKRFPEVRVVFVTGHDDDRLFLGARKLGVVACVPKERLSERVLFDILDPLPAPTGGASVSPLVTSAGVPPMDVYQRLIETMHEGLVVVDSQGVIVFVNPQMGQIVGCASPDLLGSDVAALFSPTAADVYRKESAKVAEGLTRRYEADIVSTSGVSTPVLISQTPAGQERGRSEGSLLVVTDIRRQKAIERRLEQLSATDPLTGLINRRHFQQLLEAKFQEARRYARPLACLMIDLDHFKSQNDTFGHLFGDHVLREIAAAIRCEVREPDVVARYGGEEFVVLMPHITGAGAMEAAERIRLAVANRSLKRAGMTSSITASIGIADMDDERVGEAEDLLRLADAALYLAKRSGRNQVCGAGLPTGIVGTC